MEVLGGVDFLLRVCVVPFAVASMWVSLTGRQENEIYGELESRNLIGIKYMVYVSGVSAGYAAVTAAWSYYRRLVLRGWSLFIGDQVAAYLTVTCVAGQAEFLYLGYNGDVEVTWSRVCGSLSRLCNGMVVGFGLNLVPVSCFVAVAVISSFRWFRTFQPPAATS